MFVSRPAKKTIGIPSEAPNEILARLQKTGMLAIRMERP
jgi:hypothetical protein